MPRLHHLLSVILAAALPGCDRTPQAAPAQTATYEVRGVVRMLKPGAAVIAHEEIAGYMDAMTMEFNLRDANTLDGVQPGDAIAFRLSVTDERSWIDNVRKLGATVPVKLEAPADSLQPGAPLPDCALVNQRGKPFRLHDFKGRAFAFTFIFTRCPLPDFCPRITRQFAATQAALAGAGEDVHLLSITLDPDYDTPARLAEYAAPHDTARWTFATGSRDEIEKLGSAFGLRVARDGALPDHNLRTVVVDPAGRVQRIFTDATWTPAELAAEIRRAMASGR
ncbi:MAG: SCO family protein [Chthoniobacteraceae bacterium]